MTESPLLPPRRWLAVVTAVVVVALGLAVWADRSTSVTFDEPVLVGIGARAVMEGDLSMLVDQPPLVALLHGVAVSTLGPTLPDPPPGVDFWEYDLRYVHGRAFYFGGGNDPRAIASAARVVSLGCLLLLLAAIAAWGYRLGGWPVAGLAVLLTAFVPDVLAHGAVAYNDLPLAPAFLLAVWSADRAARSPSMRRGAAFGAVFACAMAVKYSAVAIAPVAVVLLALQSFVDRSLDPRRVGAAALGALVAFWVVTATVWGGEIGLARFVEGFWFQMQHAADGHPAPAWVAGMTSADGWWWYFPAAWIFKVPLGLQVLALIVLFAGCRTISLGWRRGAAVPTSLRGGTPERRAEWARRVAADPLRAPLVAIAVYGAFLLRSDLNIGFRYALPVLPLITLVIAVGLFRWGAFEPGLRRRVAVALIVAHVASTLSVAPHFLSFESLAVRGRPAGEEALLDSNVDWGQGLVALARWMDEEGVPAVNLSYFGSGLPEGYGIAYRALPSFLPIPPLRGVPEGGPPLEWTAVSATNLPGLYLEGDPFAELRARPPDATIGGGSIHLWRSREVEGTP